MKTQNINIRLIIDGCLNGNEQSQRTLYAYYYGYGMNIALRYARNKPEAEEIYNDAFLRVFRKLDKYDPIYPFKSWLRKVVIHAAIDYHRKYKKYRYTISLEPFVESSLEQDYYVPPLELNDDPLPIIQQLPPAYRLVFNLYVMEGYKHHEIAEQLNISVGTSKSNLARAKTKLRELWLRKQGISNKLNEHG